MAKRIRRAKKNPDEVLLDEAVVEATEGFHGTEAHELFDVTTRLRYHTELADLGELVSIEVEAETGDFVTLKNFDGARLAMDADRCQLYIEGGDQSVDLDAFGIRVKHDKQVLGRIVKIVYFTTKHHLGSQGGTADYHHELAEEGGRRPTLIYDQLNELLEIAGGTYTIPDEGIRD
jgi:hypothetical protein